LSLGMAGGAMIVLGIDTAGPMSGVALVADGEVLAALAVGQRAAFTRPLLRSIDRLLSGTGYTLADLGGIAVNVGPGAYTGLRVGLATAQGLAMASGKPLVGCSAFDALVTLVSAWDGAICPVLDARKGEVYAAVYHQQDQQLQQVMPGIVVTPEGLCLLLAERTLLLGSGIKAYRAVFTAALGDRAVCVHLGMEDVGVAVSVARLGQVRLEKAVGGESFPPVPLYIRPADARLPRHAAKILCGSGAVTPGV
jgi:tRNA threonylcarbamoyladenosine biosynthesis protein TsaB